MSFFFFLAIVMFMRFYHRLNMEKKKKENVSFKTSSEIHWKDIMVIS